MRTAMRLHAGLHSFAAPQQPHTCPFTSVNCLNHHRWRRFQKRALIRVQPVAAFGDDEAPAPLGDWREFRAKLVSQSSDGAGGWATRASQENLKLLQIQSPALAAESVWAHATTKAEVVIVLIQQSPKATIGLILNRPTGMVLGRRGKTGAALPLTVDGATHDLQEVFAENRLYCGGFRAQQMVHIMHRHGHLSGTVEVIPGVFLGGEQAASKAAAAGELPASDFKFFSGCMFWGPDELQAQIKAGAWYPAASCRSLILKQCLQLPRPLWRETMELMGGRYQEEARRMYEADE